MHTEELRNLFKSHLDLGSQLWSICKDYVEKNHIREDEEFHDFFMKDNDTIRLLFVDCSGDYSGLYSTVTIEELSNE